jgi:hypothetical protein
MRVNEKITAMMVWMYLAMNVVYDISLVSRMVGEHSTASTECRVGVMWEGLWTRNGKK